MRAADRAAGVRPWRCGEAEEGGAVRCPRDGRTGRLLGRNVGGEQRDGPRVSGFEQRRMLDGVNGTDGRLRRRGNSSKFPSLIDLIRPWFSALLNPY